MAGLKISVIRTSSFDPTVKVDARWEGVFVADPAPCPWKTLAKPFLIDRKTWPPACNISSGKAVLAGAVDRLLKSCAVYAVKRVARTTTPISTLTCPSAEVEDVSVGSADRIAVKSCSLDISICAVPEGEFSVLSVPVGKLFLIIN